MPKVESSRWAPRANRSEIEPSPTYAALVAWFDDTAIGVEAGPAGTLQRPRVAPARSPRAPPCASPVTDVDPECFDEALERLPADGEAASVPFAWSLKLQRAVIVDPAHQLLVHREDLDPILDGAVDRDRRCAAGVAVADRASRDSGRTRTTRFPVSSSSCVLAVVALRPRTQRDRCSTGSDPISVDRGRRQVERSSRSRPS